MLVSTAMALLLPLAATPATQPVRGERDNFYGAHLLIQGAAGRDLEQLRWARHLVGRWGYAKTLFHPITADTPGPKPGWVEYVTQCHKLELIPVIRLGGPYQEGRWVKPAADAPGDYRRTAAAVRRVVEGLPRIDACPLYIEVWNEPNLPDEWSGAPSPAEYAAFFVQVARAIREIGDRRIRVLNGALALNPEFMEQLCREEPAFAAAFDVYAGHPYPMNLPPGINHHDGTAPRDARLVFDAYFHELLALEKFGLRGPPVMLTETGYDLGNRVYRDWPMIDDDLRADYMMRAFRDHYSNWRDVIAVIPFIFHAPGWERFEWVHGDSKTASDGTPTHPRPQYTAVAALAKPNDDTGAISGTIMPVGLEMRLEFVNVRLDGKAAARTDSMGNYFIPRLVPGQHRLEFEHEAFWGKVREVQVDAGRNTVADARLPASRFATISGVVQRDGTVVALGGVQIELMPGQRRLTSAADGSYRFERLVPGKYQITARHPGYLAYTGGVVRARADSATANYFSLGRDVQPPHENLLTNPSFEEEDAASPAIALGFELHQGTAKTRVDWTRFHTGRRTQLMTLAPVETQIRQVTHYNTIAPGKNYLAGAWIARESPGRAWITASFMDNSGRVLRRLEPQAAQPAPPHLWKWQTVEGVAPPGSARMAIEMRTQGDNGKAWFDDLYVGLSAAPAATAPASAPSR